MADLYSNDVPCFEGGNFFKNNERVYIQLSTEFPKFVGVMHKHTFVEIVFILSGEAIHTVGDREYKVKCGDVTVIPGQRESKCQYATESELYNYTLLCLQLTILCCCPSIIQTHVQAQVV